MCFFLLSGSHIYIYIYYANRLIKIRFLTWFFFLNRFLKKRFLTSYFFLFFWKSSLTNMIFHFQFIFFLFGQKYDRFEFIFLAIIKELFFKILVLLSKIWPIPLFYLCHFSRGKFDNIKRAIERTENYYIFKVP